MLIKLIAGGLIDGLTSLWKVVFGDKAAVQAAEADDMSALREQFAAEFTGPERIGWWNSLVDGLNRLVRPIFTFGTLALFIWAVRDPTEFAIAMTALQAIPEALWIIMGTIVVFWFGGRALEGLKAPTIAVGAMRALVRNIEEMKALQRQSTPMPEDAFQKEMADESTPLSDDAIAEWNRRRK